LAKEPVAPSHRAAPRFPRRWRHDSRSGHILKWLDREDSRLT
jgi:hypothetical protein